MRIGRSAHSGARSPARRGLALVAILTTFVAAALAFVLPWLPAATPGGSELDRYWPSQGSGSRLQVIRSGGGIIEGWETVTATRTGDLSSPVGGPLDLKIEAAIRAFYARGGKKSALVDISQRQEDVQIIQSRTSRLDPANPAQLAPDQVAVVLRERRGLLLIGRDSGIGGEVIIDPPAVLLPSGLRPGRRWSSRGTFGPASYVLIGRAGPRVSYSGPLGSFDDCITIEIRLTIGTGAKRQGLHTMDRRCAGVGIVESKELDPAGRLVRRYDTIGADDMGTRAGAPPPLALPQRGRVTDPRSWRLERFDSLISQFGTKSFAPVYLGGDPPMVLTARKNGDLEAQEAAGPAGRRWRFHADGAVLGAPAIDRRRGRIYFGATDKRLYALDARGLFLWSHRTGDSVSSRPAVAGATVVFGSEDRSVYGLDADTGARRWRARTGGPVVSGPAVIGSTVVIGSDDGAVYGLNPLTGDERWRRKLGGAVEAPIVAKAGVAYAVSRRGIVAALSPHNGKVLWKRDLEGRLRTAPALGRGLVLVISLEEGTLTALDRKTGRERWTLRNRAFVGPPAVTAAGVIVGSEDGLVRLLDFSGRERLRWKAPDTTPDTAGFQTGPTLGGGAVWLSDDRAIRRLGPPRASRDTLRPDEPEGPGPSTPPPGADR